MELERYRQKLELCFTEYENLQVQHIDIMKNESMPDLAAMTQKRDKVFIRLKENLDNFVKNAGVQKGIERVPELAEYETRLTSIMAVSEELSIAIQEYKNKLMTNLAKIKQGKAAMQGYKAANINY